MLPENIGNSREVNGKLMRRATYAAVFVGILLATIKFIAYLLTGSVSILSSLIDSMLDIVASTINLFAVKHSLEPADEEHQFGHGKIESLAGLAQAAFITGSSVFLVFEAVKRLFSPSPITYGNVGIGVMIVSIFITFALVKYQKYVITKTGSVAISADSLHYVSDLLMYLCVIAAIVLSSYFDIKAADPVFAMAIAAFILYSARQIAIQALAQLMDRELPDEDREKILQIALSHEEVKNVHGFRTRASGPDIFIQLHLEMDGDLVLQKAHDIADDVEKKICEAFPNADVIIHEDPEDDQ